jgi:hypothetical protein
MESEWKRMCSENSSKGPALRAVLCEVKFLIVGDKYDDIAIRSFPQIWANDHRECTHLGILPVLRLAVLWLWEGHHPRLHDFDTVQKRETCGVWSENGLESDDCVSSRQRREKTAKRVDFLHDRWELFQNPTIKAFAGSYFYLSIFLRSHCWKMLGSVCSRWWSPLNPLEVRNHGVSEFQWTFTTFA